MSELVHMPCYDKTETAARRVRAYFDYPGPNPSSVRKFWSFVGVKDGPPREIKDSSGKEFWVMPLDVANRIERLAGPHYIIFIKAMLAAGHAID